MIESEGILKPVIQRSNTDYPQKPLWGCVLCKKNKPHKHEQLSKSLIRIVPIPNQSRTLTLMKDIKRLFFPNYRGRWFTIRPVSNETKP